MASWSKKKLTDLFSSVVKSIPKECQLPLEFFILDMISGILKDQGYDVSTDHPFMRSFDPLIHHQGTIMLFEKDYYVNCELKQILAQEKPKSAGLRKGWARNHLHASWHQIVIDDVCLSVNRRNSNGKKRVQSVH